MSVISDMSAEMFRPPINRAMKIIDRSFFKKTIPTSAARILDQRQISKCRSDLHHDLLKLDRMQAVKVVRDSQGNCGKALLLKPVVQVNDTSTWSPKLSELVKSSQVVIMPFDLEIDYDYWTYHDIMSSILPEDEKDEYPTGFSIVGHIAHLNLRDHHLPYKNLIAEVLLDKNPTVRTVINKIDEVGDQNAYRTFSYELLAGDRDMNVEVHEGNCTFRFDYSKVYWNSRLETEHRRLVESFKQGEAICDVMAGVGPFAIPAGKKKCFVWANDLNPDSFDSLENALQENKVSRFVRSFNEDGHKFIRDSARDLLAFGAQVDISPKCSRSKQAGPPFDAAPARIILTCPRTFNHYVLNLPASAITFLFTFIGLYAGQSGLFVPDMSSKLPMIHVYCFSTKSEDNKDEEAKICREISEQLGHEMKPGNPSNAGEVEIWDVRDVAPLKRMFCASFRLPPEVAFRQK